MKKTLAALMAAVMLCSTGVSAGGTGEVYFSCSTDGEKKIALTFDDGPSNHTEKILDILTEYDVKATFFLIGDEIREDRNQIPKKFWKFWIPMVSEPLFL